MSEGIKAPVGEGGEHVVCAVCRTPLRIVSMTSAGITSKCDCGRSSWTQLSEGKLDLGLPQESSDK